MLLRLFLSDIYIPHKLANHIVVYNNYGPNIVSVVQTITDIQQIILHFTRIIMQNLCVVRLIFLQLSHKILGQKL